MIVQHSRGSKLEISKNKHVRTLNGTAIFLLTMAVLSFEMIFCNSLYVQFYMQFQRIQDPKSVSFLGGKL